MLLLQQRNKHYRELIQVGYGKIIPNSPSTHAAVNICWHYFKKEQKFVSKIHATYVLVRFIKAKKTPI